MDNNTQALKKLNFHMKGSNKKIVPALVGVTGIGKTAIVNRLAKDLDREVIYFNMSQQNEGDNAIPVPYDLDKDAKIKFILHHKFQEALRDVNKEYIVFCDELTRAQIPVISEWMTILNEREFQGYKFKDNVRFIAAMNPTPSMKGFSDTDYAATEIDDAHAARFTFIYMEPDREDWLDWASKSGIHESIITFLKDPKHLNYFYGKATQDVRMRCPRTWEYLSDQLHDLEEQDLIKDRPFVASLVADQIGDDVGPLFATSLYDYLETIEYDEVMSDKKIKKSVIEKFDSYPLQKQIITLDSICDVFVEKYQKDKDFDLTQKQVDNFIELWNILKSEDAKMKLVVKIDNNTLRFDNNGISNDSLIYKFYKNKSYNEFNEAIHEKK